MLEAAAVAVRAWLWGVRCLVTVEAAVATQGVGRCRSIRATTTTQTCSRMAEISSDSCRATVEERQRVREGTTLPVH